MKTFLLILLAIAALIVLIGLIRVRVRFVYGEDGAKVFLNVLFIKFGIYPIEKKKIKNPRKAEDESTKEEKGGELPGILKLLNFAKEVFGKLRRKLHVDSMVLDVVTASDDPFKTAMLFGGSGAAIGVMLAILENLFIIRDKKVSVNADFSSKKTTAFADVKLSLTIAQIISLAIYAAFTYAKLQKSASDKN